MVLVLRCHIVASTTKYQLFKNTPVVRTKQEHLAHGVPPNEVQEEN
jgi:hypothetical protein